MRKKLSILLVAAVLCLLTTACIPTPMGEQPSTLPGDYTMEMIFSSGAGGWRTILLLHPDGTFTGQHSDSDMGDAGYGYPDGTVYLCDFSGRFEALPTTDPNATSLRLVDLTCETAAGRMKLEDGIRYIYSEPIGLYIYEEETVAEEFILYSPDTPVATLSDEMLSWWPGLWQDTPPETLDCYALWSSETGSAFFSSSGYFYY